MATVFSPNGRSFSIPTACSVEDLRQSLPTNLQNKTLFRRLPNGSRQQLTTNDFINENDNIDASGSHISG